MNIYTVSVYTENNIGLLNRISAIFQRRHINIEDIDISASEIEGVSRWTLAVQTSEAEIKKVIGQIEKHIEVIKAYYNTDDEIISQEVCLFKMRSDLLLSGGGVQQVMTGSRARIVTMNKEFFVLEKSGTKGEIEALYKALKPFGIMQFVRSGRIVITKNEMNISEAL